MSQPIRVGIIGIGQRGLQHLGALWKLQSEGLVEITVLIDAFEDNLAETKIQGYVNGFQIDGTIPPQISVRPSRKCRWTLSISLCRRGYTTAKSSKQRTQASIFSLRNR